MMAEKKKKEKGYLFGVGVVVDIGIKIFFIVSGREILFEVFSSRGISHTYMSLLKAPPPQKNQITRYI